MTCGTFHDRPKNFWVASCSAMIPTHHVSISPILGLGLVLSISRPCSIFSNAWIPEDMDQWNITIDSCPPRTNPTLPPILAHYDVMEHFHDICLPYKSQVSHLFKNPLLETFIRYILDVSLPLASSYKQFSPYNSGTSEGLRPSV